jgi:hypothetical protein
MMDTMVVGLAANQTQVQRIIQSKTFRASELHRNLLQYLAEKSLSGTADGLKEYTVGLDVFAKPASYDPRQESVVRMHVARLRQKLAEYYRTEGVDDPVIVDIPKGAYEVTFEPREIAAEQFSVVTPEEIPRADPKRRNEMILITLIVLAAVCACIFGFQLLQMRKAARVSASADSAAVALTPELQQLWGSILNTDRPLMICLTASNGSTGAGTASGAFLLGQFLADRKNNVLLTDSDQLAMPEVVMDNVIFLGPALGSRQIQALSAGQPLVLESNGIRNLSPRSGEPAFIPDEPPGSTKGPEKTLALVSHVPGLYRKGDILYLSANQISSTLGAVRALTDPTLARMVVSKLKSQTGAMPRFYQMVLRVESMDSMPIEVSYILHRELSPRNPAPIAQR